ncbi:MULTISPECIES: hypothetical protein [unclassified Streptomyces]|uniref:hypothetical protein n=1 Tax=unclassified Streptomyces TaxID=2593676 RepID=UPI002254EFDD|nr:MULTISPECIES: hypothetical protein [unclassified Streptomyces]MCX5328339.1 hypothetical protein [Streptomyces sp. NBC_00140]MCX5357755.1 hypothetical protein [Streptomyces sp. NBC_00124]
MAGPPPPVVVAGGKLLCGHGGQIAIAAVSTRLTVGAKGVLLAGKETDLPFLPATPPPTPPLTPCSHVTTDNPTKPAPCITKAADTTTTATKLTVGGIAVVVSTTTGTTTTLVPNPVPPKDSTWSLSDPGQARLRAV